MKRAAAASIVVLALLAGAPGAQAALHFKHCGAYGFACARLGVPLDRTGAVPGRVSLFVKRIRARRRPSRGVVFALAGGPGQSASFAFGGDGLGDLYPAYRRRDLVVFDQRGTGRSGLLRCRRLERANLLAAGDAAADCARGLARWNEVIKKHGIDVELTLPHRAFHRAIGIFADVRVSPDGRVIGQAEWDAKHGDWLPNEEDKAYIQSLMYPVTEPGKFANWIAPPPRGINGQPVDFEYVRLG